MPVLKYVWRSVIYYTGTVAGAAACPGHTAESSRGSRHYAFHVLWGLLQQGQGLPASQFACWGF
jgi:hypothetical protein